MPRLLSTRWQPLIDLPSRFPPPFQLTRFCRMAAVQQKPCTRPPGPPGDRLTRKVVGDSQRLKNGSLDPKMLCKVSMFVFATGFSASLFFYLIVCFERGGNMNSNSVLCGAMEPLPRSDMKMLRCPLLQEPLESKVGSKLQGPV